MSARPDDYEALASQAKLDVGIGSMLLNIADPEPGAAREYNRWYEDDHFLTSAMMAPWVFAGRRFVAPSPLRARQWAHTGGEFDTGPAGSFLGIYWIAPGHLRDYLAWMAGVRPKLEAEGRSYSRRELVFTTFADHSGTVYRDDATPRDVFALMDPPGGVVVELIDTARAEDRPDTRRWLLSEHLPRRVQEADGAVTSVMVFHGTQDVDAMREGLQRLQRRADNDGRRLVLVWFLAVDPVERWDLFTDEPAQVNEAGRGTVEWLAPYIPARMGTDTYVDQLA